MLEEAFPLRGFVASWVWACGSYRMRCALFPSIVTGHKSMGKRILNVGRHVPHVARCSVCIEK